MIDGIQPKTFGRDKQAYCLMIFGWTKPVDSSIQTFVENLFAKLGSKPMIGTGHSNDANSHGSYNRVKRRIFGFLDNKGISGEFGFRIRSENLENLINFFPCDVEFVANKSSNHPKQAQISVSDELISSPPYLVDLFMEDLLQEFGEFCGGCWSFPSQFGPAAYLSSLGTIPNGVNWGANRAYSNRITRYRDNVWKKGITPSSGYFREIYPINFLLLTHLNMPFRNKALSNYIESHGELIEIKNSKTMFRWNLTTDMLINVRHDLENSGLIISSETEPLSM